MLFHVGLCLNKDVFLAYNNKLRNPPPPSLKPFILSAARAENFMNFVSYVSPIKSMFPTTHGKCSTHSVKWFAHVPNTEDVIKVENMMIIDGLEILRIVDSEVVPRISTLQGPPSPSYVPKPLPFLGRIQPNHERNVQKRVFNSFDPVSGCFKPFLRRFSPFLMKRFLSFRARNG